MTPDDLLLNYAEPVRLRAMMVGELIRAEIPGIQENVDVPAKMIAYTFGPRYVDTICMLMPSKKGVKLGFYKGSELPDPEKLLTGPGKVHKYVEIADEKMVGNKAVRALLKAAHKAYLARK